MTNSIRINPRYVLYAVLFLLSCLAANYVGSLVGWLIGVSASPIAKAIAPLIFGLLGVIGVRAALADKGTTKHKAEVDAAVEKKAPEGNGDLWRAILVATMVVIFCRTCYYAVPFGVFSRTGPYRSVETLLGSHASKLDPDSAAAIYSFRLRARAANVQFGDYESFMVGVVLPILKRNDPKKIDRLKDVLAQVESALPKDPMPQTDGVAAPVPVN